MEGLLMSGGHFSVQNYIGSMLELSAVWAITHADLIHKNIKGFVYSKNSLSNFCAILSRWQL